MGRMRARIALGLVVLALFVRLLVPAGFMPAAGQGFAITLCTGTGAAPAWIDEKGNVHKGKPATGEQTDQPCAFAGFAAAFDLPGSSGAILGPLPLAAALLNAGTAGVAVGRGLVAPPPPSTGPPASL